MTKNEIGREEAKLRDLAEVLTPWLSPGLPAHSVPVPLPVPKGNIRCVRFKLTRQSQCDDAFVDETLNGQRCNHAEERLGETPRLKQEHDLENDK